MDQSILARSYGSPVLMCGGKVECLIANPGALVLCVLEFQRGVSIQLLLYWLVFLDTSAHNYVFAVWLWEVVFFQLLAYEDASRGLICQSLGGRSCISAELQLQKQTAPHAWSYPVVLCCNNLFTWLPRTLPVSLAAIPLAQHLRHNVFRLSLY